MTSSHGSAEFWLCYRPFDGDDDVVSMVNEARAAITADTAAAAVEAGVQRVRVFSPVDVPNLPVGVQTERTQPAQRIGDIVAAAATDDPRPVVYAGSGMPAMTPLDWTAVLESVASGCAVSNRLFSCDWLAVSDGRSLRVVAGEASDNRFALLVRDQAGSAITQFSRSGRSLLDVDTPAELALLYACQQAGSLPIGASLAASLARWARLLDAPADNIASVCDVMTERGAELFLAGRVSGADWAVLDRDSSCRVRVLSEERGLRAGERGAAHSLLAALYESRGPRGFAELLAEFGDAAFWDTRPFWSHLGWWPDRRDRYLADLGLAEQIAFQPLRELVTALSPMRAICGGHSLVAGGLLAAIDLAWTRAEQSGRWPPDEQS